MPVGVSAYVALANITLGSAASIVTFTSISAAYRDLIFVMTINGVTGTPTSSGAALRINGDSGANYNEVTMAGTGSSAASDSQTNQIFQPVPGSNPTTPSGSRIEIFDYASVSKHKNILIRGNGSVDQVSARAARWASTSAITSVTFYAPDAFGGGTQDTWNAGSTFTLYGVSA
jgi:hypothetical protein